MPPKPPQSSSVYPLRIADAARSLRHVFVRDLVLEGSIGVHEHEKGNVQRVRFNVDLSVVEDEMPAQDKLGEVVCYEKVVDGVRAIVASGHVNLVETMAERIAQMCLQDKRVASVRVRVEKLDAISAAESVGIEIERSR